MSLEDPRKPYQLAEFTPRPLKSVTDEDPRLSSDPDTGRNEKVVMWSYAVIKDGLIYVVDLRNGFYVLRYSRRVRERGERGRLPRRQLEPGRRALLRAGRAGARELRLTNPRAGR